MDKHEKSGYSVGFVMHFLSIQHQNLNRTKS